MPALTYDAFSALFAIAERSVLRLESRRHTEIESERVRLRAFLADQLPAVREWAPDGWTDMVGQHTVVGRPFRRVRVMDDPLTDYNRYMIWSGSHNVRSGEEVRYLACADANALDLPGHDFWVFDSARLVELRFTDDGRPLDHDLTMT